ncbi:YggS family pyridoxal phosphate-dependent enzyme [Eubacteriales bacterium OttesenSCG-928-M02]|nr:YggS family pyridoxal phosphate-dependent enzyme [Eubacteriales bacterium OttesenSCG-928-M02]
MTGLKDRLMAVHQRIAAAAHQVGRNPKDITLVCVSKTVPLMQVEEAAALGECHFGENRVDELGDKHDNMKCDVHWHFIGQLQTNKVRKLVGKPYLVHSLDRASLAKELDRRSGEAGIVTPVLLQVDLDKQPGRGGIANMEEAKTLLDSVGQMDHLKPMGVMTIAPLACEGDALCGYFSRVYQLYEGLKARAGKDFSVLSMGMSGDFETAIAEGATMVRIGSLIFGNRREETLEV